MLSLSFELCAGMILPPTVNGCVVRSAVGSPGPIHAEVAVGFAAPPCSPRLMIVFKFCSRAHCLPPKSELTNGRGRTSLPCLPNTTLPVLLLRRVDMIDAIFMLRRGSICFFSHRSHTNHRTRFRSFKPPLKVSNYWIDRDQSGCGRKTQADRVAGASFDFHIVK